jgi:hypothetical protein
MSHNRSLTLIALVVTALAVTACGGGAGPIGGGPFPTVDLDVVVEHPEREPISYQISCQGDTATITGDVELDAEAACQALAGEDVVRRLVEGAPADQICTEQYGGPDTATVTGTIDELEVDTVIDRANGCGINDWDELLVDLLPPAVGVTG